MAVAEIVHIASDPESFRRRMTEYMSQQLHVFVDNSNTRMPPHRMSAVLQQRQVVERVVAGSSDDFV